MIPCLCRVCAGLTVGRVWTSLLGSVFFNFHTTSSITFHVNNQAQYHECLQGQRSSESCVMLSPFVWSSRLFFLPLGWPLWILQPLDIVGQYVTLKYTKVLSVPPVHPGPVVIPSQCDFNVRADKILALVPKLQSPCIHPAYASQIHASGRSWFDVVKSCLIVF